MSLEDKIKKCVVLPDIHVPFHDEKAINPVLKFIKDFNPDVLVQVGDFYDFYDVSKFDKDPERQYRLQDEIDEGKKLWKKIRKNAPKAKLYMLEGNHEHRLPKYLTRNPELHSLRSLKLENILELKDLDVKIIEAKDTFYLNKNIIVTHGGKDDGSKLRSKAGYSANANLLHHNISGLSGHSHRLGASFKTDISGRKAWYEVGCLCRLDPDYLKNPDWQQGFAVVHYGKNFFHVQLIPITESYTFYYGGKKYKNS